MYALLKNDGSLTGPTSSSYIFPLGCAYHHVEFGAQGAKSLKNMSVMEPTPSLKLGAFPGNKYRSRICSGWAARIVHE